MGDNISTELDWQQLGKQYRQLQQENIPKEWRLDEKLLDQITGGKDYKNRPVNLIDTKAAYKANILSPKEIEITESYSAVQLLAELKAGRLTSLEVTTAFCKRAAIAQQLTSCLTEIFFNEALERAKELDKYYAAEGKVKGPLHGLPISMKDSFVVEGQRATVGYTEFLRRGPPEKASTLVNLLLDAGAVLYCKTNVPQTMMSADAENHIFGRTVNPHNTSLTAGGSTGGEGALLAFRGSPLGVGTDIAGSIRIPSLCCGKYGFKPTANRVPFGDQVYSPFPRLRIPNGVTPSAGPMGHSIEDLEAFMSIVLARQPWDYDSTCHEFPWTQRKVSADKPLLKIGVPAEDPEYPLHPPIRRTLETAIQKLEAAGHTIVRLPHDEARGFAKGARIAWSYYAVGGPKPADLEKQIREPFINSIKLGVNPFTARDPPPVNFAGDLGENILTLEQAKHEFSEAWRAAYVDNGLDALLSPGAQHTSVPHDQFGVPVYTCTFNLLDFPACIIPFGKASKELDPEGAKFPNRFDPDYIPEVTDGAPAAVQVITPRFRDEQCLAAAKIIDDVLHPKTTSIPIR